MRQTVRIVDNPIMVDNFAFSISARRWVGLRLNDGSFVHQFRRFAPVHCCVWPRLSWPILSFALASSCYWALNFVSLENRSSTSAQATSVWDYCHETLFMFHHSNIILFTRFSVMFHGFKEPLCDPNNLCIFTHHLNLGCKFGVVKSI